MDRNCPRQRRETLVSLVVKKASRSCANTPKEMGQYSDPVCLAADSCRRPGEPLIDGKDSYIIFISVGRI